MTNPLQVLIVEDTESDAGLILHHLLKAGYAVSSERVETAQAMQAALEKQGWDIVISDYSLPAFSALAALRVLQRSGLDIPFIVVSASVTEETAIELMRRGAADYLMKDRLARLAPLVRRELNIAQVRRERTETQVLYCASEEKFRQMVERANDVFYRQNINTAQFEYVSPKVKDMLGYTPEEFSRLDFDEQKAKVHPEDLPELINFREDLFQADLQGQKFIERDFRMMNKQGEYRWIHGNYSLVRETDHSPLFIVGSLSDITPRKQSENLLRQGEDKFRSIIENSFDLISVLDLNGNYLYCNSAYATVLGYDPQQLIGQNSLNIVHPDEREPYLYLLANAMADRQTALRLEQQRFVNRIRCRNGDYKWVEHRFKFLLDEGGSPVQILMNAQDINERKRSAEALRENEEKYRLMVEYQQDYLVKTDPLGRISYVNPAYCALYGKSERALLGTTYVPYLNPDDLPVITKAVEMLFVPPYECAYEERANTSRGMRWLSWAAKAILDEHGAVSALIASGRDITERKQAEALINEQLDELRRWHDLTLGREERILELKAEVNRLLVAAGQPPRFASVMEAAHE
jgi:PAS domain S-box-containing protein